MGTLILSRRLTAILPAIPLAEAIDTTPIHSVAGFTGDRIAFFNHAPVSRLHHTFMVGQCRGGQLHTHI